MRFPAITHISRDGLRFSVDAKSREELSRYLRWLADQIEHGEELMSKPLGSNDRIGLAGVTHSETVNIDDFPLEELRIRYHYYAQASDVPDLFTGKVKETA